MTKEFRREQEENKLLYGRVEAAKKLGISPSKLDALRKAGLISCVLFGRSVRFSDDDLQRAIDANRQTPTTGSSQTQFVC